MSKRNSPQPKGPAKFRSGGQFAGPELMPPGLCRAQGIHHMEKSKDRVFVRLWQMLAVAKLDVGPLDFVWCSFGLYLNVSEDFHPSATCPLKR